MTEPSCFPGFYHGDWYVYRADFDAKPKAELLAAGRFPVSCGEDCFWFVAFDSSTFHIRKYTAQHEEDVAKLSTEVPTGLVRSNEQFVVAYNYRMRWTEDGTTLTIGGSISQMMSWDNRIIVVVGNRVLVVD
ncbi:MAG: hypothetical protein R3E66_00225 [bacterium]